MLADRLANGPLVIIFDANRRASIERGLGVSNELIHNRIRNRPRIFIIQPHELLRVPMLRSPNEPKLARGRAVVARDQIIRLNAGLFHQTAHVLRRRVIAYGSDRLHPHFSAASIDATFAAPPSRNSSD